MDTLSSVLDENWNTVLSLLPTNWREMGHDYGAVQRLRGIPSEEALLRLLLIHVAKGYSLRETTAIAKNMHRNRRGIDKISIAGMQIIRR